MQLNEIWDIVKEAILPLIGIIWFFFKQKIDDMESDIEEVEDKYREL